MTEQEFISFQSELKARRSVKNEAIHPLRKALHYQALLDKDPYLTKAGLARRLGVSRPRISQIMGLLRLPADVQEALLKTPAVSERAIRSMARTVGRADFHVQSTHPAKDSCLTFAQENRAKV